MFFHNNQPADALIGQNKIEILADHKHKEYSGVEEQSQRGVVKKVALVRLAWGATFPRYDSRN